MQLVYQNWQLIVIIFIASVTRFLALGQLPPMNPDFMMLRLLTALASVAAIIFLFLIVKKLSQSPNLAFATSLSLIVLPFHIEQSRIYSPVVWALSVLLCGTWLMTLINPRIYRIAIICLMSLVAFLIFPQLQFWRADLVIFPTTRFLERLFYLLSLQYLFFKNDSFWSGGLRDVGIMLPFTLPIFVWGLYKVGQNFTKINWWLILPLPAIWLLAAAQPNFPEQRIFFLVTPYLAYIMGVGIRELSTSLTSQNIYRKIVSLVLIFLISYNYLLFYHFYTRHYSQRISNELPNEQRNF